MPTADAHIESLTERFTRESQGNSKEQWLCEYQIRDPGLEELIRRKLVKLQNGVWVHLCRQDLDGLMLFPVVVPQSLKMNVLKTLHDQSGHLGFRKTLNKAKDNFWWKGLARDVKTYCMQCRICQQLKSNQQWKSAEEIPGRVFVDGKSWSVIGVDTLKGVDDVLLTATCLYTRYVYVSVLSSERAAAVTAALERIFMIEGAPAMVVSDNGTYCRSAEVQEMLSRWCTVSKYTPRYSPWYGGFYEVSHRSIIMVLAAVVRENRNGWRKTLQEAVMYYNQRCYEGSNGTYLSPHEVLRGRKLVNPWNRASLEVADSWPNETVTTSAIQKIITEREKIHNMYEEIWKEMRSTSMKEMMRKPHKHEKFELGDYLYVWMPRELRGSKLASKWDGPYRVEKNLGPTRYMVGNKEEHAFNPKKAVTEGSSDLSGGTFNEETRPAKRKEYSQEGEKHDTQNNGGSGMMTRSKWKKARLAVVTLRPKGDLMWI